jgi:hypothetical protein
MFIKLIWSKRETYSVVILKQILMYFNYLFKEMFVCPDTYVLSSVGYSVCCNSSFCFLLFSLKLLRVKWFIQKQIYLRKNSPSEFVCWRCFQNYRLFYFSINSTYLFNYLFALSSYKWLYVNTMLHHKQLTKGLIYILAKHTMLYDKINSTLLLVSILL